MSGCYHPDWPPIPLPCGKHIHDRVKGKQYMSACKITRKSAAAHNGYSSMNCLPTLDGYQFTAGQGTDQIQSRIENSRVKLNLVSKPGSISLCLQKPVLPSTNLRQNKSIEFLQTFSSLLTGLFGSFGVGFTPLNWNVLKARSPKQDPIPAELVWSLQLLKQFSWPRSYESMNYRYSCTSR